MNTTVSITLHPASKAVADGFVPMITLRGAKGRMIGCRTPQGEYRDARTFVTPLQAEIEARVIALRMAALYPEALRCCAC